MRVAIHEPAYGTYPNKDHTYTEWNGDAPLVGDIIWLNRDGGYRIIERHWNPGPEPQLNLYVEYVGTSDMR
jgi:hypothetical protein